MRSCFLETSIAPRSSISVAILVYLSSIFQYLTDLLTLADLRYLLCLVIYFLHILAFFPQVCVVLYTYFLSFFFYLQSIFLPFLSNVYSVYMLSFSSQCKLFLNPRVIILTLTVLSRLGNQFIKLRAFRNCRFYFTLELICRN